MNADTELEQWRDEWKAAACAPVDLRASVERQTRTMRLAVMGDVLVTVVFGGGTIAWALRSPQPDVILLATVTWVFLAAAWAFAMVVNAGKWRPAAMTTSAFLDLSIRRARARVATTTFGALLGVCEIVFGLVWVYHHTAERAPVARWLLFSSVPMDVVWVFTAAFFGLLFWYRRKKQAELEYLLEMQGEISAA